LSPIDFLLQRFAEDPRRPALVWRGRVVDYGWLLERIAYWRAQVEAQVAGRQRVVILEGDYSPNTVALMLALVEHGCVVVPLVQPGPTRGEEYAEIVQGEYLLRVSGEDDVECRRLERNAVHPLYERLHAEDHPALVLFSSGSAGRPKAAVHDFVRLLEKYRVRRRDLRTLTFLLYDHIGGVDTLLYSLSNASCMITVPDRSPDAVCAAVQEHAVEVLPVSPSFLNLLILSRAYERYDLRCLKVITYGAEVMPESTLRRCHQIFPGVDLLQKFGTTEVGTLRSRSKAPDSTWFKIGGEGYGVRVVDGILQIKARSAILGYLNAPDPFSEDGWFVTGDLVEEDGEYLRILGRQTDIINVGGEKVNPAEVESVIHELDMVNEVVVYGEHNPIMGTIVCAKASLAGPADRVAMIKQIKAHCRRKLESHKVPVRITIVDEGLHTDRSKMVRRQAAAVQE
jgi:acyl-coenzyme A synthetase/AMP-(fatty) acid ligase